MNLTNPDFCESRCPICANARKGNLLARIVQRIEMVVTLGGCPSGRARRKKYGIRPHEAIPRGTLAGEPTPKASGGDVQTGTVQ
jgi:hypothetical protein